MASLAKPGEQITGIVDGQIVPATETPLLTSASTPWFGFLLEKHDAGGRGDMSQLLAPARLENLAPLPEHVSNHVPYAIP